MGYINSVSSKRLLSFILALFISSGFIAYGSLYAIAEDEESVCDTYRGAAYGLCNAYCDAMDCDSDEPSASDKACNKVADNFDRASGGDVLPCEQVSVCSDLDISVCSGTELSCLDFTTQQCVKVCSLTYVVNPDGTEECVWPDERCFPCSN